MLAVHPRDFASALPFPHAVIDGFIGGDELARINRQWPADDSPRWRKEDGKFSCKWSHPADFGAVANLVKRLSSREFCAALSRVTGIEGLFTDTEQFGGGLHCIPRGGFLKIHRDFTVHPSGNLRRVNLLLYLNEDWDEEWGGALELHGIRVRAIEPIGGRCVIFNTGLHSYHGHPEKLTCPPDRQRRSLALYYYTKGDGVPDKTVYRK